MLIFRAQREPPRPQTEKRRPEFRMPGPQSVDADQGAQADDHQYRQRPQVNGQGKIQHPVDDGHQGYGEAQHPAYEGQRMPDTVFFHNTIGLVRSWSPTKIVKIPQNPQSGLCRFLRHGKASLPAGGEAGLFACFRSIRPATIRPSGVGKIHCLFLDNILRLDRSRQGPERPLPCGVQGFGIGRMACAV